MKEAASESKTCYAWIDKEKKGIQVAIGLGSCFGTLLKYCIGHIYKIRL